MRICVYPGTFDPFTVGHLDILIRAEKLFDKVIIGLLQNTAKTPFFTEEERKRFICQTAEAANVKNYDIVAFSGLLVDFAQQNNAVAVIRGLRAVTDFEYELQIAAMNKKLAPKLETVFLMTNTRYSYLSSSMVREVGSFGGDITGLVPEAICQEVVLRLKPIRS